MDLFIWVKLLKNSLIDIMYLIISRTENNVIQEVLVILSSWIANFWINPINKSIKTSTNYGLRNLNHLIVIYNWLSTNLWQLLSMLIVSFKVTQVYILSEIQELDIFP